MAAVISQPSTVHLRMNLISQCFDTLREKGHFVHEGSSRTNYEAFWEQLNNGFSLTATKPYKPGNSSVEAFYRGTMSRSDFVADVEEHIIKRAQDKLDANLDPLLTISWDVYSSKPDRKILCETVQRLLGRQLWAMFNKLDTEGYGQVHINDITELVMKIFLANGQPQSPVHIAEWFCNQESVDFWSFFSALAEKHYHLLQMHVIQSLYEEVVHEILKQGKMVKKGHKVQTWKERWFVLTSTNLIYYESLENRIQKGFITINLNTKVDTLPAAKGRNYLFQVIDGITQRPYHICAPDPQMQKDWIEAIKVVVAAQSERGRNLVHRLTISRSKLFPESSSRLPAYSSVQATDYNDGVYRTVKPTALPPANHQQQQHNGATSPVSVPSSSTQPDSFSSPTTPPTVPSPTDPPYTVGNKKRGPPIVPYHKVSTGTLETDFSDGSANYSLIEMGNIEGSDQAPPPPVPKSREPPKPSTDRQPPLVHKTSASKIEHVTAGGYDYALVDKILDDIDDDNKNDETPPPPVPKSKGQSSVQPYHRHDNETPPPPVPKQKEPLSPSKSLASGRPVLPRKVSVEHVTAGGYDYAIVDKVLDNEDDDEDTQTPPPPVPKGAKVLPSLPLASNGSPQHNPFVKPRGVHSEGIRQQPSNDFDNRIPVFSPSKSGQPLLPASGAPAPKPRNKIPLGATKSVPIATFIGDSSGSYAQLSFSNTSTDETDKPLDDNTRGNGGLRGHPLQQQQLPQQPPPVKPSIARTKFDYSDVIMSPVASKDVDKALELKAKKPPPSMPARYDPNSKKMNPSTSAGALPLNTSTEPAIVDGVPHPYQNIRYTGEPESQSSHSYQNVHYNPPAGSGEAPPPPVPQRLESNRGDLQLTGPVPPPRSPRRPDFSSNNVFPPLPPR
ncbi:PREDICTED: leucine-rich repeat extensin-like protein 5 [Amphimedon queenslandica]|uniref:PH domain-containing protein n=1 Tax=Amphimedon queenslandica TaxID=400682 RepID=A0A1X7UYG5_AMPQE|nr:PREDICTED: leucine-rich repeat extensin-like protein 5 [Amphimedon queenslandica]XP_019851599.1 PREDICTED: leucine-rich repeat extensin-like protein 5 [Amphimedon queenslandica]|eukprot:XP_011403730.1 PREDICTED: leucine-rich repeat extensin-like protein 5 [Amphimedon queenslandica]